MIVFLNGTLNGKKIKYLKRKLNKFRTLKGFNLVELIGVLVVIGIIITIAVGGIIAARDSALMTNTQSDLRTYKNAIQQVYMASPELMKYSDEKPNDSIPLIIEEINKQLEEDWKFEMLGSVSGSGGVATSKIKRDAWNNPYGLYIYTNSKTPTYADEAGVAYTKSDSAIHIVVMSSGKNATGGPLGVDGNNYDADTRKISSASAMINNTDGIDDLGIILRMLNGNTRAVTFGYEDADIGSLSESIWVLGVPSASGGVNIDFTKGNSSFTPTMASSIGQYYDKTTAKSIPKGIVGTK